MVPACAEGGTIFFRIALFLKSVISYLLEAGDRRSKSPRLLKPRETRQGERETFGTHRSAEPESQGTSHGNKQKEKTSRELISKGIWFQSLPHTISEPQKIRNGGKYP